MADKDTKYGSKAAGDAAIKVNNLMTGNRSIKDIAAMSGYRVPNSRKTTGASAAGGKGSVKQPKGTYKYGRNVGVGSPDARESRNRIGYKNYIPGAPSGSGEMSFEDMLAAMLGGSGGGGGGSYRAYSDEQIGATEAKLRALYSRYAQDILDQQANINTNYSTSATNLGGIYDTATGNVNKSYDAARAEQTRQLLALGMTEQTPTQSFGDQTGQVSSFERLRAAVLAQNEASRNAAITNQRLASEAATREGNQQIAQTVAQMRQEMVSGGGGGGSSSGGLTPNQYASLILQNRKMDQDAQIQAAKLAASSQPKATVDWNALYNEGLKSGMKEETAINYANSRAKYQ